MKKLLRTQCQCQGGERPSKEKESPSHCIIDLLNSAEPLQMEGGIQCGVRKISPIMQRYNKRTFTTERMFSKFNVNESKRTQSCDIGA